MSKHVYTTFGTFDFGILGECECEISFTYSPGHPGSWYRRNGDPGDPPDPAEADVVKVMCDGVDITALAADAISDHPAFEEAAAEAYNDANEE